MIARRALAAAALMLIAAVAWLALRPAGGGPTRTETPADGVTAGPIPAGRASDARAVGPKPGSEVEPSASALEGTVVDALSGAGIAGAELTFS
ncbi:MAG: signal protein PDZ, partial [Anaeromyxobacteraceae bacterium]